jgi:gluconate 5-dehydrogenase
MSAQPALDDKLILLTGATGRVGRALAHGLASAGARLLLTARDTDALRELAAELGDRAVGFHGADLSDTGSLDRLFDAVSSSEHGRLHGLINNAGGASAARFGEVTGEEFMRVLTLNVVAPFLCAQHAVRLMAPDGGKILNIGSIYGSVAVDRRIYDGAPEMVQGSAPYVASKSALVNLTRDLAVQLAPMNIQVNMLSPGGVAANQPPSFQEAYARRTPLGRMAQPDDLSGTAVFLCSAAADYVTGQNILVDGGFTAW